MCLFQDRRVRMSADISPSAHDRQDRPGQNRYKLSRPDLEALNKALYWCVCRSAGKSIVWIAKVAGSVPPFPRFSIFFSVYESTAQ